MPTLLLLLLVTLAGCKDETFDEYGNGRYPDGNGNLRISLNFEPTAASELGTASRGGNAPAGDVVKNLRDFSILLYDTRAEDGVIPPIVFHFTPEMVANPAASATERTTALSITTVDRKPTESSNGSLAESKTQHVDLTLRDIPFGPYKIYVVANLRHTDPATGEVWSTTREVLEHNDISSPEALLDIKAVWNSSDMRDNAQMSGYFTVEKVENPSPGTTVESTPIVPFNRTDMSIHAWARKLTSKVTIDYDPTGLRDGITITIKRVAVRDIASSCYLGGPNRMGNPGSEGRINTDALIDPLATDDQGHDAALSHCIVYDNPIVLTSETTGYPRAKTDAGYPHTETAPALFFFENMQGEVLDKDQNGKLQDGKYQDSNGDGVIDYPNANDPTHADYKDYKDGLRYGTYIEVEADYASKAMGHVGKGTIKYRFMVGKNITTNCDAERNYHYKLTLRFLGNANEVDWHVDYDETPGFYGPNPFYVSYGYNRLTHYPLKISGKLDENYKVNLTVVQNAWWPYKGTDIRYFAKTQGKDLKTGKDTVGVDRTKLYHPQGSTSTTLEPWGGFFSLAQDESPNTNVGFGIHINVAYRKNQRDALDYLDSYWKGTNSAVEQPDIPNTTASDSKMPRGYREYELMPSSDPTNNSGHGTYTVTKDVNSTTFNVPFFTRQKQLIKSTGYTGNNPYTSYQREAKLLLKYKLKDESKPREDTIKVYQVKRLVNPMGVWRKHDNYAPFHVNLKEQDSETNPNFHPVKSIGPWRAYISRGNTAFITLNGKSQVRGGNGSEIDFTINFRGPIGADQNRCAVIRVEYNNYTCHHLIFVRQGSAPIRINHESQLKWHMSNVSLTSGTGSNVTVTEGDSPCDEGSLFRYCNIEKGIKASDNPMYAKKMNGGEMLPSDFNTAPASFNMSDGSTGVKWADISYTAITSNATFPTAKSFPQVKISGKGDTKYNVASVEDYETLIPTGEKNDFIDFSYGVLYGNDATETKSTTTEAFGYLGGEASAKTYGMRGVFIYNNSTSTAQLGGNHLFMPIGRAGYGRRRALGGFGNTLTQAGALCYAGRTMWYSESAAPSPTEIFLVPLFEDIFRSEGALYWPKQMTESSKKSLDINYRTLDFSLSDLGIGTQSKTAGQTDACFVRLVE